MKKTEQAFEAKGGKDSRGKGVVYLTFNIISIQKRRNCNG